MRRTSWAPARGQNCRSVRPELPVGQELDPRPELPPIENQFEKARGQNCRPSENPSEPQRKQVSTSPDGLKGPTEGGSPAQVETRARSPRPGPSPQSLEQIQRVVERWLNRNPKLDPSSVQVLLAGLGANVPEDLDEDPPGRRRARLIGLGKDLARFAQQVCRWVTSTEEISQWLIRATKELGPENLLAYLRTSSKSGDPGTLLRSSKRNVLGRAAETWADFTPATEKALEGPRLADIQKLVEGTVAIASTELDDEGRQQLREQLQDLLARGDQSGARRILLRLLPGGVGSDDGDIEQAVRGILSVHQARARMAFPA